MTTPVAQAVHYDTVRGHIRIGDLTFADLGNATLAVWAHQGCDITPDTARDLATALNAWAERWPAPFADAVCGDCDRPVREWPSSTCDRPSEHTTATHDCDCGETITVEQVQASPKQHAQCHLIGASS